MLRLLLSALLLLGSAPDLALACSCVNLASPCNNDWKSSEIIFFGKVLSVTGEQPQIDENGTYALPGHEVHFVSTEFFRGTAKPGEVVVYTGSGYGDCGYQFVAGTSYLVYAFTNNGRLMTGICSQTAPEVMVGGILRELRMLREGKRADDLFGTIGVAPTGRSWEDFVETHPLAGVLVYATTPEGNYYKTQTDEHGSYAFASLLPGKYQVKVNLPPGFTLPRYSGQSGVPNPEVTEKGAGCWVDAFLRPDGRISGKIIDTRGKGLAGMITLQSMHPTEMEKSQYPGGMFCYSTRNGSFTLTEVPEGNYQLVFRPDVIGRRFRSQTFFWPPDGIQLGLGQHVEHIRWQVPFENHK